MPSSPPCPGHHGAARGLSEAAGGRGHGKLAPAWVGPAGEWRRGGERAGNFPWGKGTRSCGRGERDGVRGWTAPPHTHTWDGRGGAGVSPSIPAWGPATPGPCCCAPSPDSPVLQDAPVTRVTCPPWEWDRGPGTLLPARGFPAQPAPSGAGFDWGWWWWWQELGFPMEHNTRVLTARGGWSWGSLRGAGDEFGSAQQIPLSG